MIAVQPQVAAISSLAGHHMVPVACHISNKGIRTLVHKYGPDCIPLYTSTASWIVGYTGFPSASDFHGSEWIEHPLSFRVESALALSLLTTGPNTGTCIACLCVYHRPLGLAHHNPVSSMELRIATYVPCTLDRRLWITPGVTRICIVHGSAENIYGAGAL